MLLAPILPRQGLAMLYAMRGVGKTYVALSLAYAIASGGEMFGKWSAPQPARVVYLDGEMPARTLQDRLVNIAAGSPSDITNPDMLQILTPDLQECGMPNIATPEGQQAIEPFIADADLVVIDNLATLARYGRCNEEESWTPIQGWLLDLRRRGKSALIVHHTGKSGDQRGTIAKEDILETVFALKRPADYRMEQGARFEVHFTKGRTLTGDEAKPFEAMLISVDGRLEWTTRDIEDAEMERVKALLDEGLSIRDIAEETGLSKSKVGRLKLKIEGRV